VRLNNAGLGLPSVRKGWLTYRVRPGQLAVGKNLLALRLGEARPLTAKPVLIEKLEIAIQCKQER
jgi:hypothetical protein